MSSFEEKHVFYLLSMQEASYYFIKRKRLSSNLIIYIWRALYVSIFRLGKITIDSISLEYINVLYSQPLATPLQTFFQKECICVQFGYLFSSFCGQSLERYLLEKQIDHYYTCWLLGCKLLVDKLCKIRNTPSTKCQYIHGKLYIV